MTPWEIKANEFVNCNCAYGCPCQFNALPTKGHCEAAVAMEIDEGHFGDVKLDGLRMGGIFQWPGAVHEGRGKCQPFIDERADPKQRAALLSQAFRLVLAAYSIVDSTPRDTRASRPTAIKKYRRWALPQSTR